ncbi:hypothetical protein [Acidocella sp. C78]|uniref:hypothetical protein n=1 Tax=Acidocella sp. C78 TaxID=1671486 RepID=UPI001BD67449|nr:hypothetical protein [Acidocella sp. C78]
MHKAFIGGFLPVVWPRHNLDFGHFWFTRSGSGRVVEDTVLEGSTVDGGWQFGVVGEILAGLVAARWNLV